MRIDMCMDTCAGKDRFPGSSAGMRVDMTRVQAKNAVPPGVWPCAQMCLKDATGPKALVRLIVMAYTVMA